MPINYQIINGHRVAIVTSEKGYEVSRYVADLEPTRRVLSRFGFRSLFTLPELVAIDNYDSNPGLDLGQKATLRTLLFNFQVAESISLNDPALVAGVQYIQSVGLLTAQRATQVLSGQLP